MTRLLAFDPGGTPQSSRSRSATGWSLWHYDAISPLLPIEHGQVSGDERVFRDWWYANIDRLAPDEVVCEKFIIDGRTARPDITPKAIEGVLCVLWPDTIYQTNAYKSAATDVMLERMGLLWKGQGHAVDSARHALALQKARGHRPTQLVYWPPPAAKLALL